MSHLFDHPILSSPYPYPSRRWALDADGQLTDKIIETRRRAKLVTPVPKLKKRRRGQPQDQREMFFDSARDLPNEEQEYNPTPIIKEIRNY
jgi:type III restriction enzyme